MTAPIRENTCKPETLCSLGWKLIDHLDGLRPESFKKGTSENFQQVAGTAYGRAASRRWQLQIMFSKIPLCQYIR